jgi:hypothetical protein
MAISESFSLKSGDFGTFSSQKCFVLNCKNLSSGKKIPKQKKKIGYH